MSAIVVAHLLLFKHVQAVGTHILPVAEQLRDVDVLEIGGQRVYRWVPLIVERARLILTRSVLAVATSL